MIRDLSNFANNVTFIVQEDPGNRLLYIHYVFI
jgi:hypothetical protein